MLNGWVYEGDGGAFCFATQVKGEMKPTATHFYLQQPDPFAHFDYLLRAIDHMMQDRVDSYFKVEEGLEEIDRTLGLIEEELEEIWDFSGALRLDSRLEFIEDLFEELDSEARQRPRRRRRKLNMSDFFKAAGGFAIPEGERRLRRRSGPAETRGRRIRSGGRLSC